MKTFPRSPVTVEKHFPGNIVVDVLYEVSWRPVTEESYPILMGEDDGDIVRYVPLLNIDDSRDWVEAEIASDPPIKLIVRPYDEYDPVVGGISEIPLPVTAIQDLIAGGPDVRLEALVDVNGDVATLMMTSASSMFLRYSGQWVMLNDIEPIENLDVVGIEGSGLDLYDRYDSINQSVKITSMPVLPDDDFRISANYSAPSESPAPSGLTAGGIEVPTIASARDLPAAIEFAQEHTDFQWYVDRRAKALKIEDYEPPW